MTDTKLPELPARPSDRDGLWDTILGEINLRTAQGAEGSDVATADRIRAAIAARQEGFEKGLAVVERKIKWRNGEVERLRNEHYQVNTTIEHRRIHEACLSDLHDIRDAMIASTPKAAGE